MYGIGKLKMKLMLMVELIMFTDIIEGSCVFFWNKKHSSSLDMRTHTHTCTPLQAVIYLLSLIFTKSA